MLFFFKFCFFSERIVVASDSGHVKIFADSELISEKISTGPNLEFLVTDPLNRDIAVTGGKENLLRLWDLEKGESLWTMKNVS